MHRTNFDTIGAAKPANRGPKLRTTIDGQEKFCTRCDEWWPADIEFFFSDPGGVGGLFYCCKACFAEYKLARRGGGRESTATEPVIVEGRA